MSLARNRNPLLGYAMEIGRFRHAGRVFCGVLDGEKVTEQSDDVAGSRPGKVWDYGDLVVLSPVGSCQIIDVEVMGKDSRIRLRPSASLGPHRAMVTVPRDRCPVSAMARLGCVLDRPLHKVDSATVQDAIRGWLTAIVFNEQSPFPDDADSLACISQEGFTTLGASLLLSKTPPLKPPVLWHNGRPLPDASGQGQKPNVFALLADVSGWIHMGAGDLILVGSGASTQIRPGDHVECRCAPVRSAAVNVGLRGSA